MSSTSVVVLCPGQGAQAVGMGRAWSQRSAAARAVFDEADEVLGDSLGRPLSALCLEGPAERLNKTDVSQPAIYTCSVASFAGLLESDVEWDIEAAAGLSLGEYTALHLGGAFGFADGLRLVAERGRLMQEAAVASTGGMIALIGADEEQAEAVCEEASNGDVLVCANYNAPGQIVLSGHAAACHRALAAAEKHGVRATPLVVAGAFHSPLMQSAADRMAEVLKTVDFQPLRAAVWSNVTGEPHLPQNGELTRQRLVEQITKPVRWSQGCISLLEAKPAATIEYHELAPGTVLRGLMKRIDRNAKVTNHDEP